MWEKVETKWGEARGIMRTEEEWFRRAEYGGRKGRKAMRVLRFIELEYMYQEGVRYGQGGRFLSAFL